MIECLITFLGFVVMFVVMIGWFSVYALYIGAFIKWVMGDILKEELEVLTASGLTTKDVTGRIAATAREFYLKAINA